MGIVGATIWLTGVINLLSPHDPPSSVAKKDAFEFPRVGLPL